MNDLTVVSYGGGTNSTAMLIECYRRGIKVDLILFADTGGEKPHTYAYVKMFSEWLESQGMPPIAIVQTQNIRGERITLEGWCNQNKTIPSIAFGFKSCSEKHKIRPQNKFMNNWLPAKQVWKAGGKVTKLVGFDADESHRVKDFSDDKYIVEYPLVEWDMGRDECIQAIKDSGLCLPGKSACYFCPSSRPSEIRWLAANHPDLAERALAMETNAHLTSVKGLGRSFAWKDLLNQAEMFDEDYGLTPELACGCYDGG